MPSPRSVEIKLGAEKPLKPEEAKRCELKLPMEIKRTARIRCGGRVPIEAIAYCYHVKEERVSTPIRRSEHIRGMKRKDYKEVSPEPKDYGGSVTPDFPKKYQMHLICAPGSSLHTYDRRHE
jgi:hypothetical protein